MKALKMSVLCALVLLGGTAGDAANKKQARAISAYCHVCEAVSRVSLELVGMLARYPYETPLCAYAAKIADANTYLFQRLKVPPGAEKVAEHFGKAVAAFERAVKLHKKADYKASKEAARTCRQEFWRAVAEVNRLRREGLIP